jgi:glycosyltransferase involved in cell wall biosynthesis
MKISACIIAKNEERNLPRLLQSLKGKFDEIILVDTGSKDKTKEIAKSYGCKVIEHKWKGFADARNRAVEEAKGDWLWHFDADFELEEGEFRKALIFLKKMPLEIKGLMIGVKNLDSSGQVKAISSHIFIHRNEKEIKWIGKIHETPNVKTVIGIPVFVKHYGYANPKVQLKKAKRNLKLLKEEISKLEKGSHEYIIKLFYLVQTYMILSSENKKYLIEAREKAEEFLYLTENKEKNYGFFSIYIYNYFLNALKLSNDKVTFEKYLLKVLEKKFKIPDFYLLAYQFYKERDYMDKAFEHIKKAAELFDEAERNPFFLGTCFASDSIKEFEKIVLNESFNNENYEIHLKNCWNRKKGRNLGLLLYAVSKTEKLKIAKKLAMKYPDELTLHLFFNELELRKRWKEIEKFAKIFSNFSVSNLFKGKLLEKEGFIKEALSYYFIYLENNKDLNTALHVKNLLQKLDGNTKKIEIATDNR